MDGAVHARPPPTGEGTDDYRCFLLDPKLPEDAWLTGTQVLPGNPDVVHHVILFRVDAEQVAEAEAEDAQTPERGLDLLRRHRPRGRVRQRRRRRLAGAWAPGGDETMTRDGLRRPLDRGSRIVMQVHYNLLKGAAARHCRRPRSAGRRRPGPTSSRAHHPAAGARRAAVPPRARARPALRPRGGRRGRQGALRRGPASWPTCCTCCAAPTSTPTSTTSCTRDDPAGDDRPRRRRPHAPARPADQDRGQPGHPRRDDVLDIPLWDFDDQGAQPIEPLHLDAGDTVRVTCHHAQGSATCCRRSRARRRSTSSGARAPPTRCASASSRSSSTMVPRGAARSERRLEG